MVCYKGVSFKDRDLMRYRDQIKATKRLIPPQADSLYH